MTTIGTLTLQEAAKELAGNWTNFNGFAWSRRNDLENPDDWTIIYTHNRDSGLLDLSNASAIARALKPFAEGDDPDVVFESHNHWAVGHVDGFSIRVNRNGRITEAFRTYHQLAERLADYPILDEDDYSMRELEATIDNLTESGRRLEHEYTRMPRR